MSQQDPEITQEKPLQGPDNATVRKFVLLFVVVLIGLCVFVWTQRTSIPYAGLPKGRSFYIRNEDIPVLRNEIADLDALAQKVRAS